MKYIEHIMRVLSCREVKVLITPFPSGYQGLCFFDEKELFISKALSLDDQVTTLIHECLHHLNPKRKEAWVLKTEYEVYHTLTNGQRNYLKRYLRRRNVKKPL